MNDELGYTIFHMIQVLLQGLVDRFCASVVSNINITKYKPEIRVVSSLYMLPHARKKKMNFSFILYLC